MKYIILSLAMLASAFAGCTRITSDDAGAHSNNAPFSASQAQHALCNYVLSNPEFFASPGRTESANDIQKVAVAHQTSGLISISGFSIDLDKKTYQLSHNYADPDSSWFEDWVWNGTFSQNPSGEWKMNQPEFTKYWGD